MKTEEIKTLKIEFDGEDADKFKSAIKKIQSEESKCGFNSGVLNVEEKQLIKTLSENINK